MTTDADIPAEAAYRVRLDRDACEGIFACLVRDDRFVEGSDGLAGLEGADDGARPAGRSVDEAVFDDGRLEDARRAARACPVGAIEVTAVEGAAGANDQPADGEEGADE